MANERLRVALHEAGVDPDQLAELVKVDVKTVGRWLAGSSLPRPRKRALVAQKLGVKEQQLWPAADRPATGDDPRREVVGGWGAADDPGAPEAGALLGDAIGKIDLLGHRLAEVLAAPGFVETLAAKAAIGCQVRVLLPALDSDWLAHAASVTGQDAQDFIGRSSLQRQVELAIGYMQPLLGRRGVDARAFYGELSPAIFRFDDEMVITLDLHGPTSGRPALMRLRRRGDGGLFDRFAGHFDALHRNALPLRPDPELFPDPHQTPRRYEPVTEAIYKRQAAWLDRQRRELGQAGPAVEHARGKLRQNRETRG